MPVTECDRCKKVGVTCRQIDPGYREMDFVDNVVNYNNAIVITGIPIRGCPVILGLESEEKNREDFGTFLSFQGSNDIKHSIITGKASEINR